MEVILADFFQRLELGREDYDKIVGFQAAVTGFPYRVQGGYWRLVYLSMTTITTLGYGDVVPLTWETRLLTGTEATLGIILLGLFLSSMVANREGKTSPSKCIE